MTAGLLTSAIGLLAMLGWILQLPLLASFSANLIPMAPSTALLFILMGMALSIQNRLPQNRVKYIFGLSVGMLVGLSGLIFFISSLAKKNMIIEHLGFAITDTSNGIQTGHMSMVTAVSFTACALVFLLTLSQSVDRSKRAWIAMTLALTQVLTWLIFFLAYLFVTPLMYSEGFIPPALPTSLAFLFLSIGLLTSTLVQTGLYNRIKITTGTRVSYIFLLIFILLTFGIVGGGYFVFRGYEKNFRREIEQQLTAVSELKMDQLAQWRNERLGHANVFYRNYVFSDLVKRYFKNQSDADAKKMIQTWMGQIFAAYSYDRVCLHDIIGTELISVPQTIIHPPGLFSINSAEVLKSGNVKFQDFYRDENDNKVYLSIFVPILDEFDDKKPIGVMALRIDPMHYLYPLIEKWPTPSKTAETLIIRRDGNDALFLNELRFRKGVALNLRIPMTNEALPAVKAALGQTGIVEGIDYRGVPVIADVRAVPDSPWFIVARIDSKEVYTPLKERLWMIISFIVLLIIAAGTGVGFVWQKQYKHLYREQYKTAEALKISQNILAAAEQLGKVGGWEFDIDTKALRWSDEVCRIHEVENTFKPTIEAGINFYAPASRPVIERAVQRAIGQGEAFNVELQIITAKNNLRWVHSIGNIDQERRKVFGFFQDITERKLAEQKVLEAQAELSKMLEMSNQSRQTLLSVLEDQHEAEKEIQKLNTVLEQRVIERTAQLQAANKELETFTYSVSHDLKAPLRGIDGFSKLLYDLYKPNLNEEAQSFIKTIRSSTLQMNQLIDDLLNYSRLERSQLSIERIKIKDLIKSVLSIYIADLEAGNFNININIADIELIADSKGLTIALRNLFENAIKFTKGKAEPSIQIEVEEKDLLWIISVKDNGIGFDMKYHQKIFEIFQRLQRAEDFPGTGIGLAMVSKAMQRMHGRVWAESTLGMGSTFYLEIPKNQ